MTPLPQKNSSNTYGIPADKKISMMYMIMKHTWNTVDTSYAHRNLVQTTTWGVEIFQQRGIEKSVPPSSWYLGMTTSQLLGYSSHNAQNGTANHMKPNMVWITNILRTSQQGLSPQHNCLRNKVHCNTGWRNFPSKTICYSSSTSRYIFWRHREYKPSWKWQWHHVSQHETNFQRHNDWVQQWKYQH